jgi:hypothetical protein
LTFVSSPFGYVLRAFEERVVSGRKGAKFVETEVAAIMAKERRHLCPLLLYLEVLV